ncbi:MAG: ELM1/GtrOC1 family putative glycosyltransferase [Pseudomonadota bacterium]
MSLMRILILDDGRPGHVNLSKGIAAAIDRRRKSQISSLKVDRGKWPGLVTALMTRSGLSAEHILQTVYDLKSESLPATDLIISAGGETLAANISAARLLGVPNIFYGSLRQYRTSDFTLVLTSYPRQAERAANIVQTLKPSAFDPDTLSETTGSGLLGLLVGGPSGGVDFSHGDWAALQNIIEESYRSFGIRWIASNSRRTPGEASDMLRSLATRKDGPLVAFIDVDQPAAGSLLKIFAKVSGIVCTADSSSMISEAIWARKPILAAEPANFALTTNEQDYRNWLSQNGWMASHKIVELAAEHLTVLLGNLKPNTGNPLDDLADLLNEKLPFPQA